MQPGIKLKSRFSDFDRPNVIRSFTARTYMGIQNRCKGTTFFLLHQENDGFFNAGKVEQGAGYQRYMKTLKNRLGLQNGAKRV